MLRRAVASQESQHQSVRKILDFSGLWCRKSRDAMAYRSDLERLVRLCVLLLTVQYISYIFRTPIPIFYTPSIKRSYHIFALDYKPISSQSIFFERAFIGLFPFKLPTSTPTSQVRRPQKKKRTFDGNEKKKGAALPNSNFTI